MQNTRFDIAEQLCLRKASALLWFILIFAMAVVLAPLSGAQTLNIDEKSAHWDVGPHMAISQSIPADASPLSIAQGKFDGQFKAAAKAVPNIDGRNGPLWVRAKIANTSKDAIDAALVFKFPQPNQIDFYQLAPTGTLEHHRAGGAVANDDKGLFGRFPNIPLSIAAGQTETVYIKIYSTGPILVPLQLYTQKEFAGAMSRDFLIFGLLIGCILAIALHSLSTFVATGERAFGWFFAFATASAGFILLATGIGKGWLWPHASFNTNILLFVVQGIAVTSAAMFVATYLNTKSNAPHIHRLIIFVAACAALSCFSTPLPDLIAQPLILVGVFFGPLLLFVAALLLWRRGVEGARTLVFGWTLNQMGTVWLYMRAFDIVPYTEFNHYALPLACTFTAIQFSWALSRRARIAEYNASHDSLTSLPNRLKLDMLSGQSSFSGGRPSAAMQIDLDGFKLVNDNHGHAAGDEILKAVAIRLREAIQPLGTAFRTGGDEFVVICDKNNDAATIVMHAERIITELSKPVAFRGNDLLVGASVGVAIPDHSNETIDELIERADAALYQAKRSGKGQVILADLPATEGSIQKTELARAA